MLPLNVCIPDFEVQQAMPLGIQVEFDAHPGPGQCDSSHEQDEQQNVGKGYREVHDLAHL